MFRVNAQAATNEASGAERPGPSKMRKTIGALLLGAVALTWGCDKRDAAPAADEADPSTTAAMSEDEKTVYAMGALLGQNAVQPLRLSESELEVLQRGIASTARGGEPEFSVEEYAQKFQAFMEVRAKEGAAAEKQKSQGFLETEAGKSGAQTSDTGLIYRTLQPGDGASPGPADTVKVHYHGTLTDGTVFDSSRERGEPIEFPLNQVIACWTEGVQKMKVGETAQLVCPSDIAYGDAGRPGIPPGATLVFEVELLDIK
jgi:FKBP-type peptidyl-prolyl cis-trans isomerase FkpA